MLLRHAFLVIPLVISKAAFAETLLHTVSGGEAGAKAGASVALLGDVNGDGYADFAVGEPDWGNAPAIPDRGRVRAFSGKTGAVLWTVSGGGPSYRLGHRMAGGQDYSGDGVGDLVVTQPGAVYVNFFSYYGGCLVIDGTTGAVLKEQTGPTAQGSGYGEAVCFVPDIDGDGRAEFAVGAPTDSVPVSGGGVLTEAGSATVYLSGGAWQMVRGTAANQHLGSAVAGLADMDGDGKAEFAAGVPDVDLTLPTPPFTLNNVGRIELFHITGNPFVIAPPFATIGGGLSEGLRLGSVLASGADVDGDGFGDLIAGCPDLGNGQVRVYSGKHAGLLTTWLGAAAGDRFGAAVAGAGDVNGDGFGDVAVGAPLAGDVPGLLIFNRGVVSVRSGRDGTTIDSITGSASFEQMGTAVAASFDVNSDGRPDLIAGAPLADVAAADAGVARVYAVLDFPGSSQLLGNGVAGTLGVPAISLAPPAETCKNTTLQLGNSSPAPAPTTLFLSASFQPTSTGYGGTVYTVPIVLALGLPLPAGSLALPFSVPCDPQLLSATLYMQHLVADAGAPKGVAFSPCLKIVIGGW